MRLHASQMHSNAGMWAVTECHMCLAIPEDVEILRFLPAGLITVGCPQRHRDARSGWDGHPAHLGVHLGCATNADERSLPAQTLLDGLVHQRPVGPEGLKL